MPIYEVRGSVSSAELNELFSAGGPAAGWPPWQRAPDTSDWQPVLDHSLTHVTARSEGLLVGFVNVAWDGRDHAFLLDTRVHPQNRGEGIGMELVQIAARAAADAGCEWLHTDYDNELGTFYKACGFQPTGAGLIRLPARTRAP